MQLQNRQPVLVTLDPSTLTSDAVQDGISGVKVMAFHAIVAYHSQYITSTNTARDINKSNTEKEGILYRDMEQITQWRLKTPEGQIISPDTLIPVIDSDTDITANDISGSSHILGRTADNALQIEWISDSSRKKYEGAGVDYGQARSAQCWCCVGGTKRE